MSRLLVFQHVAAEPLGTLDALIRRRGHRMRFVNFERDPDAEPDVGRYRGLIVLGGPMNVEDHPQRAHLRTEMRCIEAALRGGIPVLGICLGAQLLAHVLGAPVRRHPVAEIGWYRWRPTAAAANDRLLAALPYGAPIFQWHAYSFETPPQATHLGATEHCAHQAFCWNDQAWGLQFHLEMDAALIERWLQHPRYRQDFADCQLTHGAEDVRQQTPEHLPVMQAAAEPAFEGFLDRVGRPQRRIALPSRDWA